MEDQSPSRVGITIFTFCVVLNWIIIVVYFLLCISPASNCSWPTFRNPVSVPSSKVGCTVWGVRGSKVFYTTYWGSNWRSKYTIYNIQITAKVWNQEWGLLLIWLFRLSHSFIFFWFYFLSLHTWFMFCMLLLNFVNYAILYLYVFLLLCMLCSVYSVSLCCSVYCLCVNVYCTAATGCQPNCS